MEKIGGLIFVFPHDFRNRRFIGFIRVLRSATTGRTGRSAFIVFSWLVHSVLASSISYNGKKKKSLKSIKKIKTILLRRVFKTFDWFCCGFLRAYPFCNTTPLNSLSRHYFIVYTVFCRSRTTCSSRTRSRFMTLFVKSSRIRFCIKSIIFVPVTI